ncbi:MAG: peptidoglycan-binding protein [Alphaproteobacteria bacterium]|nr:peptidoglycan-binding protein [Alphaproteobacteria bacterium]
MPEDFRRLFEGPDEIEQFPDPFGRVGAGATEIRDPTFDPMGQKLFQDFRDAWAEGRALPELFGDRNTLEIKAGIGEGRQNRRPDVAKVETLMDALGEHDASPTDGPTGFLNTRLEEDLQRFQARNGLTVDGIVDPGGETLREIQGELSRTLGPDALTSPSARPGITGNGFDAADEDPLAEFPEGPGDGANLIPTQSSGGLPGGGRDGRPAGEEPLSREEFLRLSRESERRRKRDQTEELTEEFLEASRESERRLPEQVKELDRKYRRMLRGAKIVRNNVPMIDIDRSISAFERYLNGTGGTVRYNPDWVRGQSVIQRAEKRVLNHFADWLRGKPLKSGGLPPSVTDNILKLKPGASFSDGTDRSAVALFGKPSRFDRTTDFFNLSKDSTIKGFGNFRFTRKGNIVHVTGTIEQNWRDTFDFTPGRTIQVGIGRLGVKVETDELIFLERLGQARRFQLRSKWRRSVTGQIKLEKDAATGKNRIVGVTLKWTD